MLGAEMEIHCALGQFGLSEDIVKADLVVGLPGELMCGGTQNLLAGGIRSGVGRHGHGLGHLIIVRGDGLSTVTAQTRLLRRDGFTTGPRSQGVSGELSPTALRSRRSTRPESHP
jgi:hypothetical protein